MELLIDKDKAIKILQARLSELDSWGFDAKAWRDRTVLDCKEIFGVLSQHWLQVQHINFTTVVTSKQQEVLQEGKKTAKNLLNSYIDYINVYHEPYKKEQIVTEDFETKYYEILTDWNGLVPKYNKLIEEIEGEQNKSNLKDDTINDLKLDIQLIKDNTIQFDKVSIRQLFKVIINLPIGQSFGLFGFLIAALIGAYSIGVVVEGTNSKNELFEIKKENDKLKIQEQTTKKQTDSLVNLSNLLKREIEELRPKKKTQ